MKKYTIIKSEYDDEIIMVNPSSVYTVAYFCHSIDKTYVMQYNELSPTDGFYPTDTCEDGDIRFVIKETDIPASELNNYDDCPRIHFRDEYGDDIVLVDVSVWCRSYVWGKAVDIQHGINTDTITFDCDDDDQGWKTLEEVEGEWEHEHDQDYPNQEATSIFTCADGRKIRKTYPFFADQNRETYEFI